ncbi:hypothetical protein LUZ61_000597 [Rhynchospora tenuis]|uniref:Leucine-rich repeat-containing N-terminal plant-type domain-containing protein n=1 Tax=Rhynchospora tenuis TaxID=198213 RepID=A0AAD5ZFB6_9POAL|nr:hypothetical protein LUZ61_000597 [Rhynchospora tenuis]
MRQCHLHLVLLLSLITATSAANVTNKEDDVNCLKRVRESLGDPANHLASWDFSNLTVGSICSFAGVSCWKPDENRVFALNLPSMSLTGSIPSSLQYCLSLASLDLSGNNLSGSIPLALCNWLPYLTYLDLSSNNLNGPIPSEFSNCQYLNTLKLASNSLSGKIPDSLTQLRRLESVDFSSNRLSGSIPAKFSSFNASDFGNNPSLCGSPLPHCRGLSRRTRLAIVIASSAFGATATVSLLVVFFVYFFPEKVFPYLFPNHPNAP